MPDFDARLIGLRRQAAKLVLSNGRALSQLGSEPTPPEKQWWNLPVKIAAGRRIANEELARSAGHHNDAGDAVRHARFSQRMVTEIDPVFSALVGIEHEGENIATNVAQYGRKQVQPARYQGRTVPSVRQTFAESAMDMHNNLEGWRSGVAGRPIDPERLQVRPAPRPDYQSTR